MVDELFDSSHVAIKQLTATWSTNSPFISFGHETKKENFTRARCQRCAGPRAMDLLWIGGLSAPAEFQVSFRWPGVAVLTCRDCGQKRTTLASYENETRRITHAAPVSLATKHTPAPVAYYLEQSALCVAAGALSASATMYRAALEQLLFEQGFRVGMLDGKLKALEERRKDGTAPKWALDIDDEVLVALKKIGNGAIHPNGGDIELQKKIDTSVLTHIDTVFSDLLDLAYEQPARRAAVRSALSDAAVAVSTKK